MYGGIAQEARVRRWGADRVKVDPERSFPVGPATQEERQERSCAVPVLAASRIRRYERAAEGRSSPLRRPVGCATSCGLREVVAKPGQMRRLWTRGRLLRALWRCWLLISRNLLRNLLARPAKERRP